MNCFIFLVQVNKPSVIFIDEIDALATRYEYFSC